MSFTNPAFLYALGLLAIPVIIHLFNFRKYRRIKFTNVALLEEVKEKTQSSSRLKNLLILLCRLLAVACLVIAFAEPFTGEEKKSGPSGVIGIYIDNSPSMSSGGEDTRLLYTALDRARTIISAFPENTAFILTSNSPETRLQRQLTRSEALDEVELIRESYAVVPLTDIIRKQKTLSQGKALQSFIISDFQKSSANLQEINDSTVYLRLVPLRSNNPGNVGIDSVWFSSPSHLLNGTEQLHVAVTNYGEKNLESITIELQVNGKPAALGNIALNGGATEQVTLTYVNRTEGFNHCQVSLNDHPVSFDNIYYFSYKSNRRLNVFEVRAEDAAPAIRNLFENDEDYNYRGYTEKTIDYSQLRGDGALIVNGLRQISSGLRAIILEKLSRGEAVALFPGEENIDLTSYNNLFSETGARLFASSDTSDQKVKSLEDRHSFFANIFEKIPQNIDLPFTSSHFRSSAGLSTGQRLLGLSNGNDFLSLNNYKGGKLFVFSSSLHPESSNFSEHGLFVPVMLRIAESSGYTQQISYTIGSDKAIVVQGAEETRENILRLTSLDNKTDLVPLVRKVNEALLVYPQGEQIPPGNYRIVTPAKQELTTIGLNLSRKESNLGAYAEKELEDLASASGGRMQVMKASTASLTAAVKEDYEGKKLWKLFIVFTLVFITAEILLSRWLR